MNDPMMGAMPPLPPMPMPPLGGDPAMGGMPPEMGGMPPMGGDPAGVLGGIDPMMMATSPDGLAQIIAQAIDQARGAAHAQLDTQVDASAAEAVNHPVVQAMMAPPPQPMRGMAGGSMPTGAGAPTADPMMGF